VLSFKHEKPRDKNWKVKKIESPLGPGSHSGVDKAFNMTVSQSPKVTFKKGKRKVFAVEHSDR
jgi:hypothetical protein